MNIYVDREGFFFRVQQAPYNFAIYRSKDLRHKGKRVKIRTGARFWPTWEKAEEALVLYAEQRGLKPFCEVKGG